jgi:hypothetical protein
MQISQIIPKMTPAKFNTILKSVGILSHEIISQKSIVLYGQTKSRSSRSETLKELTDLLKTYGAKHSQSSSASGAGVINIGQTKIILKPQRVSGGFILKPSFFGDATNSIVDKNIPFSSYYSTVIGSINNTKKLSDEQKEVLISIVEYTQNPSSKTLNNLKKVMKLLGQTIQLNTINNDFSEVLGPIAIGSNSLLPIDFKSAVVMIPGRSNEPLLDYKITDKNNEFKISAKSGTTTNTLKPGDVLGLINDNTKLKKKWSKTPQYNIIKLLNEGSTKQGPIDTAMWMKSNGFESQFKWLKKAEYSEEVRQKCEDTIVQISREELDFTQIFKDATQSKIYYVKFRMSINGSIEWKLIETPKDKNEEKKTQKRVVFRSKNFVGRAKDKLGFQI